VGGNSYAERKRRREGVSRDFQVGLGPEDDGRGLREGGQRDPGRAEKVGIETLKPFIGTSRGRDLCRFPEEGDSRCGHGSRSMARASD